MKRLHLLLRIAWILPSDERYKLGGDIDCKLILIVLVAARAGKPRFPEVHHTTSLLTLGFCISSEASKVDKSGI
jgi:hypothetical protein